MLEDKDAIRELLARYCFLLDGYRLSEFAALFTADGEWISRNGTAKGPEPIEQLLRGLVPEPAPGNRRKHFTPISSLILPATAPPWSRTFWWCATASAVP